jgi:hypothetical protein
MFFEEKAPHVFTENIFIYFVMAKLVPLRPAYFADSYQLKSNPRTDIDGTGL